jgi:hypothetical protein
MVGGRLFFFFSDKINIFFHLLIPLLFIQKYSCTRLDSINTINQPGAGAKGTWRTDVYCNYGTYAVGYKQRVDPTPTGFDATGLNSIMMVCEDQAGENKNEIMSHEGLWGNWFAYKYCSSNTFMRAYQYSFYDSAIALIGIKGVCSDSSVFEAQGTFVTIFPPTWTASELCDTDAAICGFAIKLESSQGGFSDDSAMNDIRVHCCRMCDSSQARYLEGKICAQCHYTCKTCSGATISHCTSCYFGFPLGTSKICSYESSK